MYRQDLAMFSVMCPVHGRRVLLWPSRICQIRNTAAGIEVHYRCTCGHRGVLHPGGGLDVAA
jgi:hypothetical protein